jgi:serine/threonine protein kinase
MNAAYAPFGGNLSQSIEDLDLSQSLGHLDLDELYIGHNIVKEGDLGQCGDYIPKHSPLYQQQTTASTCPCDSVVSSSSYLSSLRDDQDEAMAKQLYPITGRPSNILNDYTIFPSVLGTGCYGIVRECVHRRTNQSFAVKSFEKAKIKHFDHLRREIEVLSSIQHPSIIQLVDCYEDEHNVHIVTEKCSGGELFDRIEQRSASSNQGCFDERSAARIIKSLLEAVAYLHANGIVHRDIKPENILFESKDKDSPTKLIDFGLSRRHRHGIDGNLSKFRGTIYYMSPELLRCNYSSPTDIWSTGVIAYMLLSGYPPFNGATDPEIYAAIAKGNVDFPASMGWPGKSSQCIDFIKGLLNKDPRRRFTAQEALLHPWIVGLTETTQEYVYDEDDDDDVSMISLEDEWRGESSSGNGGNYQVYCAFARLFEY